MLYKNRSKLGYSILELTIYMALLVVVLTLSADLLFNFTRARSKVEVDSEIQQNLRFVQDEITRSIQLANDVNLASGSDLNLTTPETTTNPTIFRLNNDILQVSKGGSAFADLTVQKVKVTQLNFTEISSSGAASSVQVKITIEAGNKSQSSQFSVDLRGI